MKVIQYEVWYYSKVTGERVVLVVCPDYTQARDIAAKLRDKEYTAGIEERIDND